MPVQSTLAGAYRRALGRTLSRLAQLLAAMTRNDGQVGPKLRKFLRNDGRRVMVAVLVAVFAFRQYLARRIHTVRKPPQNLVATTAKNGNRILWVPYKGRFTKVEIKPTKKSTYEAHRRLFVTPAEVKEPGLKSCLKTSPKNGHKRRSGSQFLKELRAIFSILVPSIRSKVVGLMFLQVLLLTFRTYLSLVVANLDGRIVKYLISAKGKDFLKGIAEWLLLAVPASYTNAMISYLEGRISLDFRTRLVRYIHDMYLGPGMEYYKLTNIDGSIEGADHYITSDLNTFCDAAAALYSNLGKPSIDMFFFAWQLSHNLGRTALAGIFLNYGLTALVLKRVAPPFGRLAAREAALEGEYRNAQQRLITNSEEIAFYDGAAIERTTLQTSYDALAAHITKVLKATAVYNIIEDYVLKYSWSASGFLFASVPVFLPTWNNRSMASISSMSHASREQSRMGDFITNKRLMLSMADAGGRIMYSIKDLTELAGYTQRIYQLLAALHRVQANAYAKLDAVGGPVDEYSLLDVQGTVQNGFDGFRVEDMPVVVPGLARDLSPGEPLTSPLSFRIDPGEHLLITGANGVGKTSIARIAAGLWPVYRGLLSRPSPGKITFLPQRPYFSCGTLRDQIIYPSTYSDMIASGRTDSELRDILKKVKLEYLPQREGGLDTVKEWKDVFSGGEKQRMQFARILYAKPRFAVIDEGTSAVSQDVEGLMYEVCKKQGITLITISHRISLLRYHTCVLRIGLGDDGSQWKFEYAKSDERRLTVEKEIADIKEKLAKLPELKKRRDEVARELEGASAPVAAITA